MIALNIDEVIMVVIRKILTGRRWIGWIDTVRKRILNGLDGMPGKTLHGR